MALTITWPNPSHRDDRHEQVGRREIRRRIVNKSGHRHTIAMPRASRLPGDLARRNLSRGSPDPRWAHGRRAHQAEFETLLAMQTSDGDNTLRFRPRDCLPLNSSIRSAISATATGLGIVMVRLRLRSEIGRPIRGGRLPTRLRPDRRGGRRSCKFLAKRADIVTRAQTVGFAQYDGGVAACQSVSDGRMTLASIIVDSTASGALDRIRSDQ